MCINKWDLNLDITRSLARYADKKGISCLGRIPFDPAFTEAMVQSRNVIEYGNGSRTNQKLREIWLEIESIMEL